MYLDIVDSLRCPADHDASTLVAAIDRLEGRYIAQGSLGCPVCRRRYPITDFVAWFVPPATAPPDTPPSEPAPPVDEDALARAGALLDARAPGALFVLAGERARLAAPLAVAYDVHCIAIDPPPGVDPGDGVTVIRVGERAPLARGCAAGAAVDRTVAARPALLASLVDGVRDGGRVVAPASLTVPEGLRILATDATDWVAERVAPTTEPIALRRTPR